MIPVLVRRIGERLTLFLPTEGRFRVLVVRVQSPIERVVLLAPRINAGRVVLVVGHWVYVEMLSCGVEF